MRTAIWVAMWGAVVTGCAASPPAAPVGTDNAALVGEWVSTGDHPEERYVFLASGEVRITAQRLSGACEYALRGDALDIECEKSALRSRITLDEDELRLGVPDEVSHNEWVGRVQYDVREPSADQPFRESLTEETRFSIDNDYRVGGAIITESGCATISFGFEGRCELDDSEQLGCRIDSGLLGFDPLVLRGAFDLDSGRVHFDRLSFGNERWLRVL